MASLKDIRRRIGSVKNTQQITKAMKMVAASKLRRAQQAITSARPFTQKLESIVERVLAEVAQKVQGLDPLKLEQSLSALNPLLTNRSARAEQNKIALVVISSDRGLCGAYNSGVIRLGMKRYRELTADPRNKVSVLFAGKKAYEFFGRRGVKGEWFENFWNGKFTSSKASQFTAEIVQRFFDGTYDSVEVVFTEFRSAISQVAELKTILPMDLEKYISTSQSSAAAKSSEKGDVVLPFIYEPEAKDILSHILPLLVHTQFYRVFADSLASEFGARMAAMDNATRNAGSMISRLTLEANRVRQASITKELMEIVGGAEALKG